MMKLWSKKWAWEFLCLICRSSYNQKAKHLLTSLEFVFIRIATVHFRTTESVPISTTTVLIIWISPFGTVKSIIPLAVPVHKPTAILSCSCKNRIQRNIKLYFMVNKKLVAAKNLKDIIKMQKKKKQPQSNLSNTLLNSHRITKETISEIMLWNCNSRNNYIVS